VPLIAIGPRSTVAPPTKPESALHALPCASTPAPPPAFTRMLGKSAEPQTFGVPPPPQIVGDGHAPQASVPPQPFGMAPQLAPCPAQVVGVHHRLRLASEAVCTSASDGPLQAAARVNALAPTNTR